MKKTNFDRYLDEQMQDPAFAARFKHAGEAPDHIELHFNADALIRSVEETRDHLRGARKTPLRRTDVPCPPSGDTSGPEVRRPTGRHGTVPKRRER
jgi:hypothetical protein